MRQTSGVVSVVIPCFNAERWLGSAIDSCLAQTHPHTEVIVVNDGSTDGSLQIALSYEPQIRVVSGPRKGGSAARNKGLSVATGEFVQFLDADDYLLPEKIERQVQFLLATRSDVVYGDWRCHYHRRGGRTRIGPVQGRRPQHDVLASLLQGWCVASHALLHRRDAVDRAGGWDERFAQMDDWAFLMAESFSGADIRYQPGCLSIYRRHRDASISQSDPARMLRNSEMIICEAEERLATRAPISEDYRAALAQTYYALARGHYDGDQAAYRRLADRAFSLWPEFIPSGSRPYNLVRSALGRETAELVAHYRRKIARAVVRPAS